jgi:hypothetical protein
MDGPEKSSRGNLHEVQGGLFGLSPLRSYGFQNSQVGSLDHLSGGQRHSKTKLISREAIRIESTQIRNSQDR